MAISLLTEDLKILSKLGDKPNVTNGLSADQMKGKFDEAAGIIKEYLNGVVVPAVNTLMEEQQTFENKELLDLVNMDLSMSNSEYSGLVSRLEAVYG